MDNKRAGARAFGIIFQLLSLAVILGTIVTANVVARSGASVGTNGNHDPIVWTIVASGLFAACVLAGFGYVLGMLCAIYDRQTLGRTVIPSATGVKHQYTPPQSSTNVKNSSLGLEFKESPPQNS